MKTYLLKSLMLTIGAAFSTVVYAETPREVAPLLTEGKSWLMLEHRAIPGDGIGVYYTVTVNGDTIVDGLACKRVVKTYVGREQENKTIYALREENGRIYDGKEVLLMDFNCNTGDKMPLYPDGSATDASLEVLSENTLTVNGVERRELIVGHTNRDGKQNICGSWVEGVGASSTNSFPIAWVYPTETYDWIDNTIMIACYDEDGRQIFSREDFSYKPELPREPAKVLTDGKSWRVGVHTVDAFSEVHERTVEYDIAVCGDTIVDGKACKLLESHPVDEPTTKTRLVGYEENGRVFDVKPGDKTADPESRATFLPLMDFTFFCHDAIAEYSAVDGGAYVGTKEYDEIIKIDIKEVDGTPRREISIDNYGGTICWVEGVGANFSDYTTWLATFPLPSNGKSTTTYMIECRQDGKVIFTADDFTYKYEQASIRELTADGAPADGAVYDLLGRRVANPAAGRIYISNGRKMLAK